MSRYDDLRAAFAAYRMAEQTFVQENEKFTMLIVNGLYNYLQMPKTFPGREDGRLTSKPYVRLYSLDDDDERLEVNFLHDALTHLSDGTFRFAIGVALEVSEGAFPKSYLPMNIYCTRKKGRVTLRIEANTVECEFDGNDSPDVEKVHALIFAEVQKFLARRPGDGLGKMPMGFGVIPPNS